MATYEELIAAARKADAAGESADAKRLLELAVQARDGGESRDPGFLKSVASGGAQGATFGFADEMLGGWAANAGLVGDTLTGNWGGMTDRVWDRYGETRDSAREVYADAQEARPWTTGISEVAGGILPALTGFGAVAKGANLGAQVRRGAVAGGLGGGLYGFGVGEGGAKNRRASSATGALIGAGAGAAVPLVAAGLGGVARAGKEAIANWRGTSQIADDLGIKPGTARALSDTLGVDDPAAIRAYLDDAGSHAMLADASPSASAALDTAMQSPGRAARVAHERVTGRAGQAAQDLTDALDTSLGPAKGAMGLADDIRLGSAPARKAAYDAAYAAPVDYAAPAGRRIEELLKRVPGRAIKEANALMEIEGNRSAQIMASIADDGTVSYFRMPDVRQLDYITRALNDVAAAADGQGKLGGTTAMGRAIGGLSKDIRGALKEAVPEYGKALDIAGDAIGERNALEIGGRLFARNTTREEIADAVQGASRAEIDAMKRGARSYIDEQLANVRAVISDHNIEPRQAMEALRQLTSPASQEKMRAILGDAWEPLKAEIDKAARALALRSSTSRNSATAARLAAGQALDDAIEPSLLRQGKPVAAAKEGFATAMGASRKAVNRLKADAKAELSDLLTRQGKGLDILDIVEAARARHAVGPDAGKTVGLIGNLLGFSALPSASGHAAQGLIQLLQSR